MDHSEEAERHDDCKLWWQTPQGGEETPLAGGVPDEGRKEVSCLTQALGTVQGETA